MRYNSPFERKLEHFSGLRTILLNFGILYRTVLLSLSGYIPFRGRLCLSEYRNKYKMIFSLFCERNKMSVLIPINIPEKYKCPVCFELIEHAMQTIPCGHNVCMNCAMMIRSPPTCPLCRENCSFFPDARLNRELHNEMVECTKCGEKILFGQYHKHFTEKCPNYTLECKLCKYSISYSQFAEHAQVCPKYRIECKCGGILAREDIPTHEKYYCTLSSDCVHEKCHICQKSVPVTQFQLHYEQEHLKH